MDSVNDILRKNGVNLKKVKKVLTETKDKVNEEKRSVSENMEHDFFAHLADREADRKETHRRSVASIRQNCQSVLMQIPSNIQELTLEDIFKSGGSLEIGDGSGTSLDIKLEIPKSMITSNMGSKRDALNMDRNNNRSEPLTVVTRSKMKTATKRDVLNRPEPEKNIKEPKKAEVLKSLSGVQLKTAREPIPNEEIVTLEFSTSGTPLLMETKVKDRIRNQKTFREVNLLKSTLTKSVRTSNRKVIQEPTVVTRSQMKTTTKRDVLNGPEPEKSIQTPKKVKILQSLSSAQMKTARNQIPNEEIVAFSTSGTPLLMKPKVKDKIRK